MDTIFMNSKNSKTSEPHRQWLSTAEKTDWKRSDKYVALVNTSICCTWITIKRSCENNKLKILTPV